eukprot:scaffold903_cov262-Pinguiococcus_pyrenoidosus.AAC.13
MLGKSEMGPSCRGLATLVGWRYLYGIGKEAALLHLLLKLCQLPLHGLRTKWVRFFIAPLPSTNSCRCALTCVLSTTSFQLGLAADRGISKLLSVSVLKMVAESRRFRRCRSKFSFMLWLYEATKLQRGRRSSSRIHGPKKRGAAEALGREKPAGGRTKDKGARSQHLRGSADRRSGDRWTALDEMRGDLVFLFLRLDKR